MNWGWVLVGAVFLLAFLVFAFALWALRLALAFTEGMMKR